MSNEVLEQKNSSQRSKYVNKLITIIIILIAIIVYYLFFLIYLHFFSKMEGMYMVFIGFSCYTTEPTENQLAVIEEEFGFSLISDWEVSFAISCNMMRGLQSSVRLEGKLDDIDDIRKHLNFSLPDDITVNLFDNTRRLRTSETYKIAELKAGDIFFYRYHDDEDNYYRVRIFKKGLNNRRLPFNFETGYDNLNYRIVKVFGEVWEKLGNLRRSDG